MALDGPSGAGKSTVGKRLAASLGFAYLDTGALYRAVALAALRAGIAPQDEAAVAAWLPGVEITSRAQGGRLMVLLAGEDVEPHIRNSQIAELASQLSAQPAVRAHLLELQRRAGRQHSLVAEGRDMGSVVFPEAEVKFFLTASPAERARRRWRELRASNPGLTLEQVEADQARRDRRDQERSQSPLAPAPGAEVVDSSDLDLEQVVTLLNNKVMTRLK